MVVSEQTRFALHALAVNNGKMAGWCSAKGVLRVRAFCGSRRLRLLTLTLTAPNRTAPPQGFYNRSFSRNGTAVQLGDGVIEIIGFHSLTHICCAMGCNDKAVVLGQVCMYGLQACVVLKSTCPSSLKSHTFFVPSFFHVIIACSAFVFFVSGVGDGDSDVRAPK